MIAPDLTLKWLSSLYMPFAIRMSLTAIRRYSPLSLHEYLVLVHLTVTYLAYTRARLKHVNLSSRSFVY